MDSTTLAAADTRCLLAVANALIVDKGLHRHPAKRGPVPARRACPRRRPTGGCPPPPGGRGRRQPMPDQCPPDDALPHQRDPVRRRGGPDGGTGFAQFPSPGGCHTAGVRPGRDGLVPSGPANGPSLPAPVRLGPRSREPHPPAVRAGRHANRSWRPDDGPPGAYPAPPGPGNRCRQGTV